ncbi:two-component response regulator ARR22 [Olea europaea subsp. europaea]|uniref:Two-component response regulator ARR22 n=1 Tax=Olea europaea subsp. europaea TaxID=158383 RepID=A0A8S0PRE0_OLEEU|nr:two-component response regulator ARR22 [Olea europaea subsp. europaea]
MTSKNFLTLGQTFSVLIVDDDKIIRRIHKVLLNKFGCESHAVENGKEAVDLYVSGKHFDLILMDKEMPVMDGPKATRELRAMGVNNMIVGVTSQGLDSEKQAFTEAGLDYCVQKPLTSETITSLLKELVKKY